MAASVGNGRWMKPLTGGWRLLLLCILPPVIWGVCFTANKIGLGYFSPVEQISLQLVAAVITSFTIVAGGRLWRRLTLRELGIVGLCGVLEPGLTYLFGQHGLQTANAGIASVIFLSEAVVTVLLLALLGIERITSGMLGLALLAFAGVSLVVSAEFTDPASGTAIGYGLIGLSVLMASLYAIVSTAQPVDGDAIFLVFVQQIFALLLLLIYAVAAGQAVVPANWTDIPAAQWVNLLLCGAAQFSIAFAIFQLALRASPYRAVVFLNLIPLVGLVAGYVALDERLGPLQILGVTVTIGALTWISYRRSAS